jgi:hypothetical protein
MKEQPKKQKFQPKVYTDSDFRKALREAVYNVGIQNMKINIATFALVLHRMTNMTKEQITDILSETSRISNEVLCYTDVRKEVLEETGLDLDIFVNSEGF